MNNIDVAILDLIAPVDEAVKNEELKTLEITIYQLENEASKDNLPCYLREVLRTI